jgi:hypothetical protein
MLTVRVQLTQQLLLLAVFIGDAVLDANLALELPCHQAHCFCRFLEVLLLLRTHVV